VKYEKPALSFAEQADRLLAHGLVADRSELMDILKAVEPLDLPAMMMTVGLP